MKVLWITNTIFPDLSRLLGRPGPVTGGWMYGLAEMLKAAPNVKMAVATVGNTSGVNVFDINGAKYYWLEGKLSSRYSSKSEDRWRTVCSDFVPDIIHIHGTEFPHGLACMRACPNRNYVVSIQGLVSKYADHYYAGLSVWRILRNITLRDIVKRDSIIQGRTKFIDRGRFEKEIIERSRHIIGRTQWDYAHTNSINPSVSYHHCGEILRDGFYNSPKWDGAKAKKYLIFCSQGSVPIKGLHQVLRAISLLSREFPEIHIRVAGQDITKTGRIYGRNKLPGYGKILRSIMKRHNLDDRVKFLGLLNEEEMLREYLRASVFICPSSIENSPNSIGEAQILGVPTIASFVGGSPDMVVSGQSGLLYRFEEVEMLAEYIRQIFLDEKLAYLLSRNGILAAKERHDRRTILSRTLEIYKQVAA